MQNRIRTVLCPAALGCIALMLIAVSAVNANERKRVRTEAITVLVDTSEVPDLNDWAAQAKTLVEKWYPIVSKALKSKNFTPPRTLSLVFKKDMGGVAGTAGQTITIAASWVKRHPEDFGMVIHEMTHVIQSYPNYNAPWLVEGIADYIRFFLYEPKTKLPSINPQKATYHDGYKTTAAFLAWVVKKYDKKLIGQLNQALRGDTYNDDLFVKYTGRNLDTLWQEFLADQARTESGSQQRTG